MFRKKQPPPLPPGAENPLARRFRQDAEPATVDLSQPARFPPSTPAADDPQTADLQTDAARLGRVLSRDPGTGKLYVHPGTADLPVMLQGEPVRAPTELRAGDTLRIGPTEVHIRSV
jgi:hypothetical protein